MASLKARINKRVILFARQDAVRLKAQFGPGFVPDLPSEDGNEEEQQEEGGG